MSKKHIYKLRPAYDSEKLLIEFGIIRGNVAVFMQKLLDLLTRY